jgi:TatA/E family protein of Tat protein translocase
MGPMELMVILVLALVIFGPGKLPEIAGQVGRVVRDFRRTTSDLSSEFNRTLSLEIEERKTAKAPAPAPVAEEAPAYDTYSAPVVEPAPPAPAPAVEPSEAPPALAVTTVSASDTPVAAAATGTRSRRDYDADIAPPY